MFPLQIHFDFASIPLSTSTRRYLLIGQNKGSTRVGEMQELARGEHFPCELRVELWKIAKD